MMSEEVVAQGFSLILSGLGLDVEHDPHLTDTPRRAAKALYRELCRGLTQEPPTITTFPSTTDEMVILRHIPVRSLCAHHLLPFFGEADIGYIPGNGRILGLSKLSRITDFWARRPQVQEELTRQVADEVAARVLGGPDREDGGVGVVIRATHLCMMLRGVNHEGKMVTSALRGTFKLPEVRAEFLKHLEASA